MAAKDLILDFSEFDLDHVVADLAEIRRHNPQRHEMEQLTAIVYRGDEHRWRYAVADINIGAADITFERCTNSAICQGDPGLLELNAGNLERRFRRIEGIRIHGPARG